VRAQPVKRRLRRQPKLRAQDKPDWSDNGLMPYVNLYADWLAMMATAATVHNRRRALERLVAWCDVRGLSQPEEITRAVLAAYQRHLYLYRKDNGQPLPIRSQRAMLLPLFDLDLYALPCCKSSVLDPPSGEFEPRIKRRLGAQVIWLMPVGIEAMKLLNGHEAFRDVWTPARNVAMLPPFQPTNGPSARGRIGEGFICCAWQDH